MSFCHSTILSWFGVVKKNYNPTTVDFKKIDFAHSSTFSSSTISMTCFLKYLTKISEETCAAFYRRKKKMS